jgi:hypothetical protein
VLEDLGQSAVLDHALALRCWPEDLPEGLELVDAGELSAHSDRVISMGGDGSMLGTVRQMVVDRPLIGLHMGRLGFLTALDPGSLEEGLTRVVQGQVIEQSRMMLQVEIGSELVERPDAPRACAPGRPERHRDPQRPARSHPAPAHTHRPGQHLRTGRGRADPLHAHGFQRLQPVRGGPIMDPCMQAILLTPSMAHSISHRAMVIHADSVVESWIGTPSSPLMVTVDGQESFRLRRSEQVRVRRSPRQCRLISLDERGFPQDPAQQTEVEPGRERARMSLLGRFSRALSRTRENLGGRLRQLLGTGRVLDKALLEELEEILLAADLGVDTTDSVIERLRQAARKDADTPLVQLIEAGSSRRCCRRPHPAPAPGRGTARDPGCGGQRRGQDHHHRQTGPSYHQQGRKVLIAAADTFRAAAIEQLQTWAKRARAQFVRSVPGADPASVAFDGLTAARARGCDLCCWWTRRAACRTNAT